MEDNNKFGLFFVQLVIGLRRKPLLAFKITRIGYKNLFSFLKGI